MVERFDGSDGLGAIFPPMVWSIVALRSLGYADDSREMQFCQQRLRGLIIEDEDAARLQPCKSPVWDTAITLRALQEAGAAGDDATTRGVSWLLDQQITRPGDWSRTVAAEPGGWCFEYGNDFYPDLDDTAMAVMALAGQFTRERSPGAITIKAESEQHLALLDRSTTAIAKAQQWMLAMQNRDGGWGAFDRDNDRQFLCHVPFADHNAMIDPSTPDLTARVIEALGALGRRYKDKAVSRAITYLRQTQEADGSWFGRWGVNYIYGTWQVLTGLAAVGVTGDDPAVTAGANWLLAHQQPSGGWGESPDSYADSTLRGQGPCTASQTAWAVLGLLAAGRANERAVRRGIDYLIAHQRTDGGWDEPEFTGTGFPRVFYLRYHYYPIYFPLLALARWSAATAKPEDCTDRSIELQS
jgi:squalene-hopene/tetraprenyl-beta-curcumene cyclase